jgi:uncharacterized membrane protein
MSMKDSQENKINDIQGNEPFRLVALSDGLFATVLTLLVLDLRIPVGLNIDGGNITAFIKWIGPHLFSYLLTFLVAGTYWIAQHRDFNHVIHYDRSLLSYNLLFLLFIGLLPFSTASLDMGGPSSGVYPFYWAIYAGNNILAGVMLTLTWNYAVSHHLVDLETTQQQSRYMSVRHLVTPVVFLISMVIEFMFPRAFLGPYTLLAISPGLWWVDRSFGVAGPGRQPGRPATQELLWRAAALLPWLLIFGLAIWAMNL